MFLVVFTLYLVIVESRQIGPTERFYNEVLTNYLKDIPPWDENDDQLVITFSIPFIVIGDMEENKQLISYMAKINVSWVDHRLKYNTSELGGNCLVIPTSKLWIPTFEVFNSFDVHQMDKQQDYSEALINPDGSVSILWHARFDVICQLTMDRFPFDNQWCSISLSAGLSSAERVIAHSEVLSDDFKGTSQWDITASKVSDFTYEQGGMNRSLTRITYRLHRNPQFYIYFLILPTFIITFTCLIALLFPLNMEIGEKINLCLAGLLGLTFMLSVIVQELPRTTGLPLMGKWLVIQIFFCVGAMAAHLPSNYFHRRYYKQPEKEKLLNLLVMFIFLFAHCLTSILLFVFPPRELLEDEYKTL